MALSITTINIVQHPCSCGHVRQAMILALSAMSSQAFSFTEHLKDGTSLCWGMVQKWLNGKSATYWIPSMPSYITPWIFFHSSSNQSTVTQFVKTGANPIATWQAKQVKIILCMKNLLFSLAILLRYLEPMKNLTKSSKEKAERCYNNRSA